MIYSNKIKMSDIGSFLNSISSSPVPKVYSKNALTSKTSKKLMSYQILTVIKLINILIENYVCLNASDTGTGKTYMTAAVCAELEKKPIIICPKILIHVWRQVLEYFGVKYYDIVNYETLKNGKVYLNKKCKSRKKSWYLKIIDDPDDKEMFKWDPPKDAIIIFDEAQRCKDPSTLNGKLLMSTKKLRQKKIPVMLLSGTISEKIKDMKIPFCLFNLIPNTRNYSEYIRSLKVRYPKYKVKKSDYPNDLEFKIAKENAQAMIIHEEIKEFTSRIRVKDLGNRFPKNNWYAQEFLLDDYEEICKAYKKMAELLENLNNYPTGFNLAERQKQLQKIELKKVPIFVETAKLYKESGNSVIIFVNYTDTVKLLCEQLDTNCVISGELQKDLDERQLCIDKFQANTEHIIICQMRAGGLGINLHDIHGKEKGGRPRVCLLNYADSASDMLQALGRAPRSGAKSPVRQIIIFVANVPEEHSLMKNFNKKLGNISAINDGDIHGYSHKMKKSKKREIVV